MLDQNDLTREQLGRFWQLARYLDEPDGVAIPGASPMRPSPMLATRLGVDLHHPDAQVPDQVLRLPAEAQLIVKAHELGIATDDDLKDALLVLPEQTVSHRGSLTHALQWRTQNAWITQATLAIEHADRLLAAALTIEAGRGEFDTRVSHLVSTIQAAYGIEILVSYVAALGRGRLVRGWTWVDGRDSALSRVIRYTRPAPGDTAEKLATALSAAKVRQTRVIELGMYAPQWSRLIEGVLDWPGFEEAVWWLHAHTKSDDWVVDQQLRAEWAAEVSRRTPLDADDLTDGGVDVAWFTSMHATLGGDRFDTLLKSAKFASSSGGHKRAELFANTLLGRVTEDDLMTRIRDKRHQDSVRALGLLPLTGESDVDAAVLRRYEFLRAFVASDRTSGSGRRASESKAVHVGLENLARSAGYRDPQRLIWAMEAHATRDLAAGPLTANDDDLTVTLSIDASGEPQLSVARGDRPLKSVPKKSVAVPAVAALKDRVTTLRKQRRRMVVSLEDACVTGESFTPAEYGELLAHPLIRPLLQRLVLVTDEGLVGFGTDTTDQLCDAAGSNLATDGSAIRIAHPVDLLASGAWADFQHALFQSQTKQPFKQVFRELYVPIAAEGDGAVRTERYAGHQVEARRAGGLFKSRGWVADFEVGFLKTFHRERMTAACALLQTFGTPGDVEDSTVEDIYFFSAASDGPLAIADVPPRVFSETMRDLDLVVSVAHAGGVDPETSQSTVEMRGRLVTETADLLGLHNVELTDHHAIVQGTLATYSINLGSGQVHRQPGQAVCIIPISAQHRGRIFLPFVDDDPRTAEVISKVVLLARDETIKDPTILQQLA